MKSFTATALFLSFFAAAVPTTMAAAANDFSSSFGNSSFKTPSFMRRQQQKQPPQSSSSSSSSKTVNSALNLRGGFNPILFAPLQAAELTAHVDTSSVVFYISPKIALKQFGTQLDRTNPLFLSMANHISTTQLQLFLVEAGVFLWKMDPLKAVAISFVPRMVESLKIGFSQLNHDNKNIDDTAAGSHHHDHITKKVRRAHQFGAAAYGAAVIAGFALPSVVGGGAMVLKVMAYVGFVKSLFKTLFPRAQTFNQYNRDDDETTYLTRSQGYTGIQTNGLLLLLLNGFNPLKSIACALIVSIVQSSTSIFWHGDVERFGANYKKMVFYMVRSTLMIPCLLV